MRIPADLMRFRRFPPIVAVSDGGWGDRKDHPTQDRERRDDHQDVGLRPPYTVTPRPVGFTIALRMEWNGPAINMLEPSEVLWRTPSRCHHTMARDSSILIPLPRRRTRDNGNRFQKPKRSSCRAPKSEKIVITKRAIRRADPPGGADHGSVARPGQCARPSVRRQEPQGDPRRSAVGSGRSY